MPRETALNILNTPPLKEDEGKELFSEVAKRLEISEKQLKTYHEMHECNVKFRNQTMLYNIGIRLYELLGLEKRIRK